MSVEYFQISFLGDAGQEDIDGGGQGKVVGEEMTQAEPDQSALNG